MLPTEWSTCSRYCIQLPDADIEDRSVEQEGFSRGGLGRTPRHPQRPELQHRLQVTLGSVFLSTFSNPIGKGRQDSETGGGATFQELQHPLIGDRGRNWNAD